MAVQCPFCKAPPMKKASLKRHVDNFHSDDNLDHVVTVASRAAELVGGGWDPYEHTLQQRWDDERPRYAHIKPPPDRRGVWTQDRNSFNALYDPRSRIKKLMRRKNPHTPNWEPKRPLVEPVHIGNGNFKEVFAPTWANKTQGVRGLPVLRRVDEREVY